MAWGKETLLGLFIGAAAILAGRDTQAQTKQQKQSFTVSHEFPELPDYERQPVKQIGDTQVIKYAAKPGSKRHQLDNITIMAEQNNFDRVVQWSEITTITINDHTKMEKGPQRVETTLVEFSEGGKAIFGSRVRNGVPEDLKPDVAAKIIAERIQPKKQ